MTKKEYDAAWREKNRKKLNEYKKRWMAERPGYGKEYRAAWKRDNRVRIRALERARELRAYGVTLEDFSRRLSEQEGVCAICHQRSDASLHVDHCHVSGRVRGLLCGKCNLMLGNARDDHGILAAGIAYLLRQL